jgi:hypothetical protein
MSSTIKLTVAIIFLAFSITVLAEIPIPGGGAWYRGNTHTHGLFSDKNDKNDVPEIAKWYEEKGYDFLLLSEHNIHVEQKKVFCHDEATDPPKFLMLCGLELSKAEHHTALGIDRFIGDESSLQEGVAKTLAAGGVPILNHPKASGMSATKFLTTKGLNHLEIFNGGRPQQTPAVEMLWDSILSSSKGRQVFAVASDDNHFTKSNVGRGWVMVRAKALTKEDIKENIRTGNFYATTGVILNDYAASKKTITIDSQNGDKISFIGKNGVILNTVTGNKASYQFKGNEFYVRVKISNASGQMAWTQPVFLNPDLAQSSR